MAEADTSKVMCAIRDPMCLALQPRTDQKRRATGTDDAFRRCTRRDEIAASIQGDTLLTTNPA